MAVLGIYPIKANSSKLQVICPAADERYERRGTRAPAYCESFLLAVSRGTVVFARLITQDVKTAHPRPVAIQHRVCQKATR